MNQKEFVKLSEKQVKILNNGDNLSEESWRDGYLYAMRQIEEVLDENDDCEACTILNSIIDDCRFLDQFE